MYPALISKGGYAMELEATSLGIEPINVILKDPSPKMKEAMLERLRQETEVFSIPSWPTDVKDFLSAHSALVPGAIPALKTLVDARGPKNIHIISRAKGPEIRLYQQMIDVHHVFEETGLLREQVRFVDEHKDKAAVCKALRLGGMIDSSGEALYMIDKTVVLEPLPILVWFAPSRQEQARWYGKLLSNSAFKVKGWDAFQPKH